MCGCSHMTTTTMELPSLVRLCVLISCGVSCADANERLKVVVKEDSDAVLPCSLSTKENIESKLFDWKKDGQKEVFLYDAGLHYNNQPLNIQDRQFKGRVFHFQDELQHGNASIIIRNTTVADSGDYTCDFPRLQPSQTFHIELLVVEPVKVVVKEDSDAILPCSLSTKENIEFKLFDWKKDDKKEVFLYDAGIHYNNGRHGQDEQFKRRVSHFPDQLKNGNASIKIQNTKVADRGNYTCVFPRLQPEPQTFHIELVVVVGAASRPYVKTVQTTNGMKLQCEVLGVSPIPKIEWKDSSGNVVPADEPNINQGEREGCYDVILEAPVTKTDNFSCIVTQEEIHHQIKNHISVTHGAASKPYVKTVETKDGMKLQCEVFSVSPKTKVEWKDSSGNVVPAEEPKITEGGDIILEAPLTKTDRYRCVVTQEEINHQTENDISVTLDETFSKVIIGTIVGAVFGIIGFILGAVFGILKARSKKDNRKGNRNDGKETGSECKRLSAMT